MKRVILIFSLIVLSLTGCGLMNKEVESVELSTGDLDIRNDRKLLFGISLDLLKLEDMRSQNTLISPVSIISALAMTSNGAMEDSELNFDRFFGYDREILNNEISSIMINAQGEKEGEKLTIANSIWYDFDFSIKQSFLDIVNNLYQSEIVGVDFYSGDREEISSRINSWVCDKTDRMIMEIINSGDIDEKAKMILINSILFDYEWELQYDRYQVCEDKFKGQNRESDVLFLNSQENSFIDIDNSIGTIKSYKGGKYCFVGLMPKNENICIHDYVQELTEKRLRDMISSEQEMKTDVQIPKLEYSYTTNLSESLIKLGLENEFDKYKANFGNLYDLEEADYNIYIDDVIHKTCIELTEYGTRASAVTAVELAANVSVDMEKPKKVYFNRPFLYMIYDRENKLPVFMGTVIDL